MTALPSTTWTQPNVNEEEGDQKLPGIEVWRQKCGQDSGTAIGRRRRQHKMETSASTLTL